MFIMLRLMLPLSPLPSFWGLRGVAPIFFSLEDGVSLGEGLMEWQLRILFNSHLPYSSIFSDVLLAWLFTIGLLAELMLFL
jgi:hypothetical protein